MGSASAQSSLNRVLEKHGDELRNEILASFGKRTKLIKDVALTENGYRLDVAIILIDGAEIAGEPIDIDTLAERFPDCEIGY